MTLTEEEAKTKRCCGPQGYRHDTEGSYRCIASECMAWRWVEPETEYYPGYSEGGIPLDKPAGDGWEKSGAGWSRQWPVVRRGFCGLAGTP